jgi:AGZA family xanthine/uracil permease-like MFS transporter
LKQLLKKGATTAHQPVERQKCLPWFVRGDIDGFFGLALDNFVQLLLIAGTCRFVLGFPADLLYGRILPGVAVSLLVGNLYYAWQARNLSRRTGRTDVCALPYGINTVSLIGHVFLIMLPAKLAATAAGATDPARIAWQAGLVATLASGLIECGGAFVAEKVRKATPRAALLSTLSGIALTFISLGFLFRTFARPIVGLTTLAIVMLIYFGRVKFKGRIPGGLVAVILGTLLAWLTGIAPIGARPAEAMAFHFPIPVVLDLWQSLIGGHLLTYLSVIIPMGLFNVIGSLQNIESAEAAGDPYPTKPSLMVNGIGSVAAALFGSCFPTTIYIGHPGWKAIGARAGYSILNGTVATLVCLTGTLAYLAWLVPIDAGMAIVLWIGIVITSQAFQATPAKHAPAAVLGILPGVAAWGALVAKTSLRVAGLGQPGGTAFSADLIKKFQEVDFWINGLFSLEQGFIFCSMILAAVTVCIIERHFIKASVWCLIAAAVSMMGLMHSYQWLSSDTTILLKPAWTFVIGYLCMGAVCLLAKWVTEPEKG